MINCPAQIGAIEVNVGTFLFCTFITRLFESANSPIAQDAFDFILTYTVSFSARFSRINVAEFTCAIPFPFLNHSYTGLSPPLKGIAVNVTFSETQIESEFLEDITFTFGVMVFGFTGAIVLLNFVIHTPEVGVN